MNVYEDTYLPDILHDIAAGLLVPTMIFIIVLLALTLFFLGWWIVEFFTERRHFRQNMATIVNDINDAPYDAVTGIVAKSGLLLFQKSGLMTVSNNMGLPEDSLFALAQVEIGKTEKRYKNRLAWTDTMSKIAPLLGLMGTLIPLGPGIVAMGQGDTATLSNSLLLAFDATVCGLVCAILCLIVSKVRSGWYESYIEVVESVMTCILEKAAFARKEGVQLPANYDADPLQDFAAGMAGDKGGQADDAPADDAAAEGEPTGDACEENPSPSARDDGGEPAHNDGDGPAEDASADDAPAEEAPEDDAPAEGAQAQEAPAEGESAAAAPADEDGQEG